MALFEKVRDAIVREFNIPESKVTDNATIFGDLEVESVDYQELIMVMEEEFGITFPEKWFDADTRVNDFVDYIAENSPDYQTASRKK
jgi:acyl carrier protein